MTEAVNANGGSGRGDWCTPKWLAELLGEFDLDPCSNSRSHIKADWKCAAEDGFDGLDPKQMNLSDLFRVFINPPYNRGEVIKWVEHYRHTRFVFLLKWDPSTKWFKKLIKRCTHVWFALDRIDFEPPPGVAASSNPFPHALYMRDPPADLLDRLRNHGLLLEM